MDRREANTAAIGGFVCEWRLGPGRVSVLGDFEIVREGNRLPVTSRHIARLAALLAAQLGTPVAKDSIIAALWPSGRPATAVNTMQVYVSQLRSMIGKDAIVRTTYGYLLDVDPLAVDAEWFRERTLQCLDRGATHLDTGMSAVLDQALELWRGTPYGDLEDPIVCARRAELVELRERGLEQQIDNQFKGARTPDEFGRVVVAARGQVSRMPLRQRGHELLVRALLAEGRDADARAAVVEAEQLFESHFHAGPSPHLRALLDASDGEGHSRE